jgi:hypothetical protein
MKSKALWRTQQDGCEASPRSLDCPLEKGRPDAPVACYHSDRTHALHGVIWTLYGQGLAELEIAAKAGCTVRTVFRVLAPEQD